MKPLLLLDWHITLSENLFWSDRGFDIDDIALGQSAMQTVFSNQALLIDWMRGRYRSEEINKIVSRHAHVDEGESWERLIKSCQKDLDPNLRKAIQRVKEFAHVALVTDNMDCFSRFTVPVLQLDSVFDAILNSADIGRLKEEAGGKTFRECVKDFNASFKDSLLIDDSRSACRLFEDLGGETKTPENAGETLDLLLSFAMDRFLSAPSNPYE